MQLSPKQSWLISDQIQDLNRSAPFACLNPRPPTLPAQTRPGHLPAQNMLSVMRIRVEALHTGRSTMGRFTTCRTLGCTSVTLDVHISFRLPQPVTRPLYPARSSLQAKGEGPHENQPFQKFPRPQHCPLETRISNTGAERTSGFTQSP